MNPERGPELGVKIPRAPSLTAPVNSTDATSGSHVGQTAGSAQRAYTSAGVAVVREVYELKVTMHLLYTLSKPITFCGIDAHRHTLVS